MQAAEILLPSYLNQIIQFNVTLTDASSSTPEAKMAAVQVEYNTEGQQSWLLKLEGRFWLLNYYYVRASMSLNRSRNYKVHRWKLAHAGSQMASADMTYSQKTKMQGAAVESWTTGNWNCVKCFLRFTKPEDFEEDTIEPTKTEFKFRDRKAPALTTERHHLKPYEEALVEKTKASFSFELLQRKDLPESILRVCYRQHWKNALFHDFKGRMFKAEDIQIKKVVDFSYEVCLSRFIETRSRSKCLQHQEYNILVDINWFSVGPDSAGGPELLFQDDFVLESAILATLRVGHEQYNNII
ncbi:hypothetical protein HAX54_036391 [Datura stramonium]|uniref:Uncharacterized protein n=1 Tax=Datura stramonium TaxID=4076 RepID=A0ABS8SG05_DATST|nr:hypothetical protein [Datura stramonium]